MFEGLEHFPGGWFSLEVGTPKMLGFRAWMMINKPLLKKNGETRFHQPIHPRRLTWNIIMEVWKMIFLSKWVICRFHVNLPGCKDVGHWTSRENIFFDKTQLISGVGERLGKSWVANLFPIQLLSVFPIGSIYGTFTYIWLNFCGKCR